MSCVFYKVTGKSLAEWLEQREEKTNRAINETLKFSRRVGGHRSKFGKGQSFGHVRIAVIFKECPPNWKVVRLEAPQSLHCVPRSGRSKDQVKLLGEFDRIEKLFPSKGELADRIELDVFGKTGRDGGLTMWFPNAAKYGETWILYVPDYWKPPTGLGVKRVSDLYYESLLRKSKKAKKSGTRRVD